MTVMRTCGSLFWPLPTLLAKTGGSATGAILTALHGLVEAPWADIKGKPLNDRGLAVRLRPYEVKPKLVRIGDHPLRGYTREDLHDAWRRYLGPPPIETVTSVTPATSKAH
jgi:Protein of unknown function (DUF3631)